MAEPRLTHRLTFWAPRTLVALSCALALLAIQPANAAPTSRSRPVAFKENAAHVTLAPWQVTPTFASPPAARLNRLRQPLFANPQSLHILATVEILQRLLVAELQPVQQHFFCSLWLFSECAPLVIVQPADPVASFPQSLVIGPHPEVEKAFAMAHCQLAPPPSLHIA